MGTSSSRSSGFAHSGANVVRKDGQATWSYGVIQLSGQTVAYDLNKILMARIAQQPSLCATLSVPLLDDLKVTRVSEGEFQVGPYTIRYPSDFLAAHLAFPHQACPACSSVDVVSKVKSASSCAYQCKNKKCGHAWKAAGEPTNKIFFSLERLKSLIESALKPDLVLSSTSAASQGSAFDQNSSATTQPNAVDSKALTALGVERPIAVHMSASTNPLDREPIATPATDHQGQAMFHHASTLADPTGEPELKPSVQTGLSVADAKVHTNDPEIAVVLPEAPLLIAQFSEIESSTVGRHPEDVDGSSISCAHGDRVSTQITKSPSSQREKSDHTTDSSQLLPLTLNADAKPTTCTNRSRRTSRRFHGRRTTTGAFREKCYTPRRSGIGYYGKRGGTRQSC